MPDAIRSSRKRPPGRLKGTRITVQPLNVISRMAERFSLTGTILTYQDVADALSAKTGLSVSRASVWRLAKELDGGENPRASNKLRAALGLPNTIKMEVVNCKHCHKPHYRQVKRCPDLPKKVRVYAVTHKPASEPQLSFTLTMTHIRLVYQALAYVSTLTNWSTTESKQAKELIAYLERRFPLLRPNQKGENVGN